VRPRFSTRGDVRLRYTYPEALADPLIPLSASGKTIVSRIQQLTVR
jgi:hypothetical protein